MPYQYPYNQPYMPQYQAPTQPTQPFLNRVRDEQDVVNFPVAPGVTAFFINESADMIFSKTMDASQLDRPRIVKFKRVPDEVPVTPQYATKEEVESLRAELTRLTMAATVPSAPAAPTSAISNGMPSQEVAHE